MRLFCSLGWHLPKRAARWNNGYYFTKCGRCGHDLVRTARGRWRVPQGHRVVWPAGLDEEQRAGDKPLRAQPQVATASAANGAGATGQAGFLKAQDAGRSAFDWAGVMHPAREAWSAPSETGESLAEINALERQLGNLLGLKVQIRHGAAGGIVAVEYATLNQLDTICQRLSGQTI